MKIAALAWVILIGLSLSVSNRSEAVPAFDPRYMAFCLDGDGPLTDWLPQRDDAYSAGRDHERQFRDHRWEVWARSGSKATRVPVCGRISEGDRPDSTKLENTCSKCVRFRVTRMHKDGAENSREFNINGNARRHFRKIADSQIFVMAEGDCS